MIYTHVINSNGRRPQSRGRPVAEGLGVMRKPHKYPLPAQDCGNQLNLRTSRGEALHVLCRPAVRHRMLGGNQTF